MVIALFLIGIVMLVAAVRGTQPQLIAVLKNDFTGQDNFIVWMAALFAIGAVGYYKPLKPVSTAFLGLVIVVMILAQQRNGSGGLFQMLAQQIKATQQGGTLGQSVGTKAPASSGNTNVVNDAANSLADSVDKAIPMLGSLDKTVESWGL